MKIKNRTSVTTQKEDHDPKMDIIDINRKVKECKRQIDKLVYKLYNPTPKEIKIVKTQDDI